MSPDRVGFALRVSGSRDSQNQGKGLFRAWPMFADHRFAARSDEMAQNERHDDRVVELPGDGDEVWDEVERQRQIATEGDEQQLVSDADELHLLPSSKRSAAKQFDGFLGQDAAASRGEAPRTPGNDEQQTQHDSQAPGNRC